MAQRESKGSARWFLHVDWFLFLSVLTITALGLVTMRPFEGDSAVYFDRQILWITAAVAVFFLASIPEYRILRRSAIVTGLYTAIIALLAFVFLFGAIAKGAQSRFDLGFFLVQPAEPAKLILIIVLAKYFARRHVEIAHIRHILVSGAYALFLCLLVFLQPDFGSAIIIASVWFGMVLVAGISWRHLLALTVIGLLAGGLLWQYGLQDYQQDRILTFLHPLADIQGAGYNAYQSTIAIGSGETLGKGVGLGTQSKLRFLPEYQTDFIFAAYAEEWGFVGVLLLFGLYAVVIARVLVAAVHGTDNFVTLFGAGVCILLVSHFLVHIGMNMGLLPVTGTTVPFMSYGGSHLLVEFAALGMLMGMRRARKVTTQVVDKTELVGGV